MSENTLYPTKVFPWVLVPYLKETVANINRDVSMNVSLAFITLHYYISSSVDQLDVIDYISFPVKGRM